MKLPFLQAMLFNRTVKQIEGDNVSAMEVSCAINVFIEHLEDRKKSNFLSTSVVKEIEKAAAEDNTVSKQRVLNTAKLFYGKFRACYFS